jgi:hypothetical protein
MNQETRLAIKTIALRYARAFIAGGIASLATFFAASQFNPETLKDPKVLIISVGTAFIAGGLQAIDKLLRWQSPSQ